VLAIMDTTDLRFATHAASNRGFGRDANDTCPGLFLHPVLAVEAGTGGVTGLVDCVVLNRTEPATGFLIVRRPLLVVRDLAGNNVGPSNTVSGMARACRLLRCW
jgi:hypothetical protein